MRFAGLIIVAAPLQNGKANLFRRGAFFSVMTPHDAGADPYLALVERCRRGDALAWEQLVRHCQGRVYGLAWHYLRNAEDARDVAQEAFIRVYRQLDAFEEGRFLAWLLRITRNLSIDQLRRRKVRPPAEDVRDAGEQDQGWRMTRRTRSRRGLRTAGNGPSTRRSRA